MYLQVTFVNILNVLSFHKVKDKNLVQIIKLLSG